MSNIQIDGFTNRSGDDTQPFGYIDFTDGMRVTYAPGAGEGTDYWGLGLSSKQAYLLSGQDLTPAHYMVARAWIVDNRMPVSADFHPVGI